MIINYRQGRLAPDDVVTHLALTGGAGPVLFEIVKRREAAQKARELNLAVTDEELQKAADAYRAANSLYSAQETYDFFRRNGLSDEDFERFLEDSVLTDLLRDHLADENKVREYFINHRSQYDRALISVIVVAGEELANEIKLQVEEDEVDFASAAGKYSLDDATKQAGGRIGLVSRGAFPPDVSAKVFNAAAGELVGPFDAGGAFQLIQVHEVRRAELTANLQELIKDTILDEWARRLIGDDLVIEK